MSGCCIQTQQDRIKPTINKTNPAGLSAERGYLDAVCRIYSVKIGCMQSGIFCVDIGTSSLKAAFITESGTVMKFIRLLFPQPVQAADWVRAFFSAWAALPADCTIQAICVSGNGPSLVALPHRRSVPKSEPSLPASPVSAELRDSIIEAAKDDILFLWNEPLPPDFTVPAGTSLFLPRIAAFHTKYPEVFDTAAYLFSGPEYIAYLLTGTPVTVLPDPRYEVAYWNRADLPHFAESVLRIDGKSLTKLLPPFTHAGTVLGAFCGIPVIAGVPDFIAALIGTGTLIPGNACDRAGSSEGLNICIPQPIRTAGALLLPSVMPALWNISSVIPSSGAAFSAFLVSHGFLGNDYIGAMKRIAAEPFIAQGVYPATFAGQGRAFVENLAFRIRRSCDVLETASGYKPVYTLSGGQAYNPCWCQMKADMTGRTFALPAVADAELLGDALLALHGLNPATDIAELAKKLIRIERYYEPDRTTASWYTEKYIRQSKAHC